uniref:Uncharacterized protein n=1 Tax=Salix viminalis TaxID=40686 RepID=A0A6N2KS02_SALVM
MYFRAKEGVACAGNWVIMLFRALYTPERKNLVALLPTGEKCKISQPDDELHSSAELHSSSKGRWHL